MNALRCTHQVPDDLQGLIENDFISDVPGIQSEAPISVSTSTQLSTQVQPLISEESDEENKEKTEKSESTQDFVVISKLDSSKN